MGMQLINWVDRRLCNPSGSGIRMRDKLCIHHFGQGMCMYLTHLYVHNFTKLIVGTHMYQYYACIYVPSVFRSDALN